MKTSARARETVAASGKEMADFEAFCAGKYPARTVMTARHAREWLATCPATETRQ